MLIEFSVANFRSIRDKLTLSMEVSEPKKRPKNLRFSTNYKQSEKVWAMAGLYGANASGKTNIIKALAAFHQVALLSNKLNIEDRFSEIIRGDTLSPYLLSGKTRNSPSQFKVVFKHENYVYEYEIELDNNFIHKECLYAIPLTGVDRQRKQMWFIRDKQKFDINTKYIDGDTKTWQQETKENNSFLAIAANRNSKSLQKISKWFRNKLSFLAEVENADFTDLLIEKHNKKNQILQIIQSLDFSFADLRVREMSLKDLKLPKELPEEIRESIIKEFAEDKPVQVVPIHKTEDGDVIEIPMSQQSDGTKSLYAFAGYLLNVFENGRVLFIDEIEKSLHPVALNAVVELFNNQEINKKGAQLIFTSHATHLLKLLDKDQIYLFEKNRFGASSVTCVSEFSGIRNTDDLEKQYLSGRYGALPNIDLEYAFHE
jgi:AAA15 family ATPase/GTPase